MFGFARKLPNLNMGNYNEKHTQWVSVYSGKIFSEKLGGAAFTSAIKSGSLICCILDRETGKFELIVNGESRGIIAFEEEEFKEGEYFFSVIMNKANTSVTILDSPAPQPEKQEKKVYSEEKKVQS